MHIDQDALASEIQRLRKANRRWRAVAVASLLLVFAAMLPLTHAIRQTTMYFQHAEIDKFVKEVNVTQAMQQKRIQDLEKQLKNGKAPNK